MMRGPRIRLARARPPRASERPGGIFMRKLTILGAVTASVLAAGVSVAQIPVDRCQAGTLTCDISGGIGFIIGSQKALNCSFVPALPGPPEFYSGVITKLGIDLGGTTGGVMMWAVYAPTSRAAGFARRHLCRRFRRGDAGSGRRRQPPDRRVEPHRRAAAAVGSGADRGQHRGRRRRHRTAMRAVTRRFAVPKANCFRRCLRQLLCVTYRRRPSIVTVVVTCLGFVKPDLTGVLS